MHGERGGGHMQIEREKVDLHWLVAEVRTMFKIWLADQVKCLIPNVDPSCQSLAVVVL